MPCRAHRGSERRVADPRYWLGFHLTKGIGPARLERLLAYFGDLG